MAALTRVLTHALVRTLVHISGVPIGGNGTLDFSSANNSGLIILLEDI